ncbi:MAG: hypothetical protein JW795_05520 [Chitinivibrionales bacterium]|nr:hypothetical protein [Chitinivibrionales bacterium]
MKKVAALLYHAIFFSFMVTASVAGAIKLIGFVPPTITAEFAQFEYTRVYQLISGRQRVDRSDISIVFYSRSAYANDAYSLPEWGGGGAIGTDQIIVPIDKKPFLELTFGQTVVHELVHIAMNRVCDTLTIPRWFHEGCALILSAEARPYEEMVISKALFMGKTMPLAAIDSVNSFPAFKAELAYCQSRQALLYLIETYGISVITEIIAKARSTGSFWRGVYETVALTEPELTLYYEQFMIQRHNQLLWLTDDYLLWVGMSILFIIGFVLTIIRRRRKFKIMALQEQQEELEALNNGPENAAAKDPIS